MVTEKEKQEYQEYVEKITPTHSLPKNMAKAFLVGGLICVLGQMLTNWGQSLGLDEKMSGSFCSVILVLLSTLLTALNIWPYIGKFGGAGALVPITGFANSVAAPAVEYQTETRRMSDIPSPAFLGRHDHIVPFLPLLGKKDQDERRGRGREHHGP